MSKRPPRMPTAAQRTISMFTGKTDLDDPERARDGYPPAAPKPAPPKGLKWDGGVARWWTSDGPRGEEYVIQKQEDGYHAYWYATKLGTFDSIHDAGQRCDDHYDARIRRTPRAKEKA